jgi:hypothetical protein
MEETGKPMALIVKIRCGGAAFEESPGTETGRLLRQLAEELESEPDSSRWLSGTPGGPLFDTNGNRCGYWRLGRPET